MRASKRIGRIRSVVTDNGCEFLEQAALDRAFGAKFFWLFCGRGESIVWNGYGKGRTSH